VDDVPGSVLIVGIGNELLGDEGVGVHVARALIALRSAAGNRFDALEAGTSLFDAVPEMSRYERVVLIDAMHGGGGPGTLYRLNEAARLADGSDPGPPLSLHDWSAADTLRAARTLGLAPRHLTLIGVEPASVAMGTELSPPVRRAAERVVMLLLAEIGACTGIAGPAPRGP
jgi:hydrogenase maturation protease